MTDISADFEKASRLKLRYETPRGVLAVEDLWDLPLSSERGLCLNDIAVALHNTLKHDTVSFVEDAPAADERLQLSFDLVKHVIDVRRAESKAAAEARVKREKKQKILSIIARKEDAAMEAMDIDALRAAVEAL